MSFNEFCKDHCYSRWCRLIYHTPSLVIISSLPEIETLQWESKNPVTSRYFKNHSSKTNKEKHVTKTGEHKKKTWLKTASLRWASGVHFVANKPKTEYTFYLKFDSFLHSLVLFRIGAVNRLMQVVIFVVERKKPGLLGNTLLFNSRKRTGTPEDLDKMVQIILETSVKSFFMWLFAPFCYTLQLASNSFFIKGHGKGLNFFHSLQTFKSLLDPSTNV